MDNRNAPNKRVTYTGRFANAADSAPPRSAAPVRPRAASSNARTAPRPSGFASAAPEKRRAATAAPSKAAPAKAPEKPMRKKEIHNKRAAAQKPALDWKKLLLIGIPLLIVLVVVLVLAFGNREEPTYHQLPTITRGSSSAFTPDGTDADESSFAPADEAPFAEFDLSGASEAGA